MNLVNQFINSNITSINNIVETFIPLLQESQFFEKGVLTPEEFIICGDQLVHSFRTWKWSSGNISYQKAFLPKDKQFIIFKNAVCLNRSNIEEPNIKEEQIYEEGKEITSITKINNNKENILDIDNYINNKDTILNVNNSLNLLEELEQDNHYFKVNEEEDNEEFVKRTYDIMITYDKFYQTPRIWLYGYDYKNCPLGFDHIKQDISNEYVDKTVTFEIHPHLGYYVATIHPCKHSYTMKNFINYYHSQGKPLKVNEYLFLFLKFISTVIPNIEYDFTIDF